MQIGLSVLFCFVFFHQISGGEGAKKRGSSTRGQVSLSAKTEYLGRDLPTRRMMANK